MSFLPISSKYFLLIQAEFDKSLLKYNFYNIRRNAGSQSARTDVLSHKSSTLIWLSGWNGVFTYQMLTRTNVGNIL